MDSLDRTQIKMAEDIAVIKERTVATDDRIGKIETTVEKIDGKLDVISDRVTCLETANRVLKWAVGFLIAVLTVIIAIAAYLRGI